MKQCISHSHEASESHSNIRPDIIADIRSHDGVIADNPVKFNDRFWHVVGPFDGDSDPYDHLPVVMDFMSVPEPAGQDGARRPAGVRRPSRNRGGDPMSVACGGIRPCLVALVVGGALPAAWAAPNVLFIAVDDLRPEAAASASDLIRTPNAGREKPRRRRAAAGCQ